MFTADGLRPDSPHLMPPRGAACVLSLFLSHASCFLVPLLLLAGDLSRSRSFSPPPSRSLARSLACLSLVLVLVPVPSTCTALHRCILLRSMSFALPTSLVPAPPRLSCGQRKGGEFGRWKQERISGRERTDTRKGDSNAGEHEKRRETTGSPNVYTRMIDSTRIRGEFICKGVVNGGREYGGGCVL